MMSIAVVASTSSVVDSTIGSETCNNGAYSISVRSCTGTAALGRIRAAYGPVYLAVVSNMHA
jgi:hypothetical protein